MYNIRIGKVGDSDFIGYNAITGIANRVRFHIAPDPWTGLPDYELAERTIRRHKCGNFKKLVREGPPEKWC